MALADELLDSISEEQFAEYMLVEENPHIVIDEDRNIILPERYKIIAAQGDHDMTTYTFDCPRFSDGRDMSKMVVYINYIRSDGETGSYPADNVSIDAQDNDLMHFEWTPLLPATLEHGAFAFLVCVCRAEPDGSIKNHWSTRLCKDATISEGMDCHKDTIINMYPDVITRILERLNVLEDGGTTSVQYTVQDLEEEQKVQARKNIEAADAKEVSKLSEDIATKSSAIKEKASGEVIVVTDSDEGKPLGLAIDGKSEQTQYSGKNLLNTNKTPSRTENGITLTPVFDEYGLLKYLEINGTASANAYFFLSIIEVLDKEATFKINGHPSDSSINGFGIMANCTRDDGTVQGYFAHQNTTITSGYKQIQPIIYIKNGQTVKNIRFYPMVRLATVTDDTYEPYVGGIPSPNPSYPQEIRNIGVYDEASGKYAVEVKCNGKNLSPLEKATTIAGGYLNASTGYYGHLKKGKTYTFSAFCPTQSVNNLGLRVLKSDGSAENLSSGNFTPNARKSYTFTPLSDGALILSFNDTNYPLIDVLTEIQLEYGTVATDYEPYKETTATVLLDEPLIGLPVSSGGNYTDQNGQQWICDEIVKYADGSGEHIQRFLGLELTKESNIWSAIEYAGIKENHTNFRVTVEGLKKEGYVISNAFPRKTNIWNSDVLGCFIIVENAIDFTMPYEALGITKDATERERVSAMKTYLENHEVCFCAELATPITEEIDIDLGELSMFYPTTVISNDCNANMEVTYIADTKNYIDKLKAKHESDITALKTAIVALGGTV